MKNFQAGRRARCPVCSGRFRVPTTSSDFSTPLEDDEQELASTALTAEQPGAGRSEASPTFELKQPTADLDRFKRPAPENTHASAALPSQPDEPATKRPASGKKLAAKKTVSGPMAAASQPTETQVAGTLAAASQARPVAGASVTSQPIGSTASTSPGMPAAIAEAPQAVWYVRPPSGGQFGPADSATFYQWMKENRVAREALVWRDGWPQWLIASEAFEEYYGPRWIVPESQPVAAQPAEATPRLAEPSVAAIADTATAAGLGAGLPTATDDPLLAGALGIVPATDAPTPVRPLGRRKRRQTNYTLGIGLLAIVAIVLVVVLVTVLMAQ